MKHLIKLLIQDQDIRHTPSIYMSITLAYLEMKNWAEANYITYVMQDLELKQEEREVCLYLEHVVFNHDEQELKNLLEYLNC